MSDSTELIDLTDSEDSSPEMGNEKTDGPMFSLLVPVYHPEIDFLDECIESVLAQTTSDWELCLVADGPQPEPVNQVLKGYRNRDSRIKVHFREENGGIAAATDDALNMATGEFIALLDNDDTLAPHALGTVAWEMANFEDVDFVFSDEDHLDAGNGERINPFHKPGFSRERLRQQMYLGHLVVCRRSLAIEVGGFRPGFDGSQDHDISLRATEKARRILHIPQVLYHWRECETSTALDPTTKDWAYEAGVRVVQSHLERTNFPAVASRNPDWPGIIDLEPQLTEFPLVSVIIPTGGYKRIIRGEEVVLVDLAVKSLLARTTYPNVEVIVVLDKNSEEELGLSLQRYGNYGQVKFVQDTRDFNFSHACNLGAARASGDLLLFHNDDTEIIQPDWLDRMVMYATREDIGAVGAKLLYSDGRIQHAGIWSREGCPFHRYAHYRGDHPGYLAALATAQNAIAVTGACLLVERHKFDQVGGFATIYPLAYNDVDLCLKLNRAGYRSVVDCATKVVHHESSTRDPTVAEWEFKQVHERWKPLLHNDPYDNPNHIAENVDEYPPPNPPLTIILEEQGKADFHARAWPAQQEHLYCG